MRLSYVIITRNRRERLLRTLRHLADTTPLPPDAWEAFVIDNGSEDDTPAAVRKAFASVQLIALPENEGMPARNHALPRARGRYVAFLDDDSYPIGNAVPAALHYLAHHPKTAALAARVLLPSGEIEAPAFPAVTLGGASIVRKSVLREVGGFAPEFFRQAEEYDLSFRIWQAGYRIERFEDLVFKHDKDSTGRCSALTHKMDLRNNLILVERYLPRHLRGPYRSDWIRRYGSIALHEGHRDAVNSALCEARVWARREQSVGRRVLGTAAIEHLFDLDRQAAAVAAWASAHRVGRAVIGDFSKNLYATYRACQLAGVRILAVADGRPAFAGQTYRRAPILADAAALALRPDGVVLSTVNPAHVDRREAQLRDGFAGPLLRLWEPRYLSEPSRSPVRVARDEAA